MHAKRFWSTNCRESAGSTLPTLTGRTVLFLVFFLLMLIPINDHDIWYHLVIGRKIADLHSIPSGEFYIYTMLNDPVAFHEWGFGLLNYLLYDTFGHAGMNMFNALLGAMVLFLLFRSCGQSPLGLQLFFGLLTILFLRYRLLYRPENILFLAMAVELYVLERYLTTRKVAFLGTIPLLCFLLNQFHPSALFLLFIFGMYAVQSIILTDTDNRPAQLRMMSVFVACSIIASFLNPYGYHQTLLPISFGLQKTVLTKIQEFMPIYRSDYFMFYILFVIAAVPAILASKGRKFVYTMLFLFFSLLTFKYARNFALLTIVMFVPLVRGYTALFRQLSTAPARKKLAQWLLGAAAIPLLAVNILLIGQDGSWGTGIAAGRFPTESARYLGAHPHRMVFNYYPYGGYLGWINDGLSVFIDGRHYTYDRSWQMHDSVMYLKRGWDEILHRYDIDTIIIPSTVSGGDIFPLIHHLSFSDDWQLVVEERAALGFQRAETVAAAGVPSLDKKLIWQNVIRASSHYEDENRNLNTGIAYFRLHRFNEAYPFLKAYQRLVPADREINTLIRLMEASASGDAKAMGQLEEIYSRKPAVE